MKFWYYELWKGYDEWVWGRVIVCGLRPDSEKLADSIEHQQEKEKDLTDWKFVSDEGEILARKQQ